MHKLDTYTNILKIVDGSEQLLSLGVFLYVHYHTPPFKKFTNYCFSFGFFDRPNEGRTTCTNPIFAGLYKASMFCFYLQYSLPIHLDFGLGT